MATPTFQIFGSATRAPQLPAGYHPGGVAPASPVGLQRPALQLTQGGAQGSPRNSVRCAAVNNIVLTGVIPSIIDSVSLAVGDRVALVGQTNAIENGIYVVGQGINPVTGLSQFTLTRSSDAQTAQQLAGLSVVVDLGGTQQGAEYVFLCDPDTAAINASPIIARPLGIAQGVNPTAQTDLIGAPGVSPFASPSDHKHPISPLHRGTWVRVAATSNVPLSGNTTTTTIDGVVLNVGDRILLPVQLNAYEPGIYIVQTIPGIGGATQFTAIRAPDANTVQSMAALTVVVEAGSVNAGTIWVPQVAWDPFAVTPPLLGTTAITFSQPIPSAQSGVGVPFDVHVATPNPGPGSAGSAFDWAILGGTNFSAGFPWPVKLLDSSLIIITNVAASTVTIRTATGGGGTALSTALSSGSTGRVRDAGVGLLPNIPANTPLYARMTDGSVVFDADLRFLRNG